MTNRGLEFPKEVARQLLAYEAAAGKPGAAEKDSAAFRVCEAMRGPLEKLLGAAGFHSLLTRALTLAGAEVPWLRQLQIKPGGALPGLDELEANLDARASAEGELHLVGHLLGLLVIFIGPALTLGVLRDIWPKWKLVNLEEAFRDEKK